MAWRPAASITQLINEINAKFPTRSKVTDGIISGYPGSRSSHQVNSQGVVCAVDITTGQAAGLSMAQGEAIANHIRGRFKSGFIGFHAYVIFNRRIAHAGTGWEWAPYNGSSPHTDHIHVSVDHDIVTGQAPSGLCNYDTTASWGIASVGAPAAPAPAPAPARPAPARPAPLAIPVPRTVTTQGAKVRRGPGTGYGLAKGYEGGLQVGEPLWVIGYVKGQDPYNDGVTDDAWYLTKSRFYVWANGASNNISGLPYLGEGPV